MEQPLEDMNGQDRDYGFLREQMVPYMHEAHSALAHSERLLFEEFAVEMRAHRAWTERDTCRDLRLYEPEIKVLGKRSHVEAAKLPK